MTLGALELRVRFQLRRPTIKINTPAKPTDPKAPSTGPVPVTGTATMPKIGASGKLVPKGAITYDKVVRQLKQRGKGVPFLEKLSSLFGAKKPK